MPNREQILAFRFAVVHIGDGDILGQWAKELYDSLTRSYPGIYDIAYGGEHEQI